MNVDALPLKTLAPAGPLIEGDTRLFQDNFNRASFQFAHHLAGHPLFELAHLIELARVLPEADVYYDAGDIRVNQRWDQSPKGQLSVDQLIDRVFANYFSRNRGTIEVGAPALRALHHPFPRQPVHHRHYGGIRQGISWGKPSANFLHGCASQGPQRGEAAEFQGR